ncbi:hypothetical protein V0288_02200, partial [Pannus brasiliensis CCIBt3594]
IGSHTVATVPHLSEKGCSSVKNELKQVPDRLNELARNSSIKVFSLSETMLERQVSIGASDIFLEPFDLAILAAILVKAEEL